VEPAGSFRGERLAVSALFTLRTVGYSGFLVGPPLIGALAQWAALRVGLGAVTLFCAAGAILAIRWRDAPRQNDPSRRD
jgi:hypothetical protein